MQKRIDIRDLEILLEDADDFKAEARKYFEPRYTEDGRVSLQIKRNIQLEAPPITLDGRPAPYAAGFIGGWIADWVIELERKSRRKKYRKKKDQEGVIRVVAEGDSWFQHPLVDDLIDWIEDDPNIAVLALARAGDELRQMVNPGEYLQAVNNEQPKVFLLSAGGNDFLGDIRPFLTLPANQSSQNPKLYLSPEFPALLDQLVQWLDQVFSNVLLNAAKPPKHLIMHGYAYAIPCQPGDGRSGKWLGEKMRDMDIESPTLQQAIVVEMIDQYSSRLETLAADARWAGRVQLLDLRKRLPKANQWYDEIHPRDSENKKLAKPFISAIKKEPLAAASKGRSKASAVARKRKPSVAAGDSKI